MGFHCNVFLVFCQLKFNICVRCDMAFIEPMHRNKPDITYLLLQRDCINRLIYSCINSRGNTNWITQIHVTGNTDASLFTVVLAERAGWTGMCLPPKCSLRNVRRQLLCVQHWLTSSQAVLLPRSSWLKYRQASAGLPCPPARPISCT